LLSQRVIFFNFEKKINDQVISWNGPLAGPSETIPEFPQAKIIQQLLLWYH
jgi:hypothetical protein